MSNSPLFTYFVSCLYLFCLHSVKNDEALARNLKRSNDIQLQEMSLDCAPPAAGNQSAKCRFKRDVAKYYVSVKVSDLNLTKRDVAKYYVSVKVSGLNLTKNFRYEHHRRN